MYFEGVQDLLKQLADPALSDVTDLKIRKKRAMLEHDLDNLDHDRRIRVFLKDGGKRPNLDDVRRAYLDDKRYVCVCVYLYVFMT